MDFSLSKPQVKPGDVFTGTLLCEFYAITLSNSSAYFSNKYKSCCLGLANNSRHQLLNAKCYVNSGSHFELPHTITPASTGFFASTGSLFGSGSAGVLTFDILNGSNDNRLQVMWSIPSFHTIYDLWVNVDVGTEQASKELFAKLYRGQPRAPTRAVDTPLHVKMDAFDAIVVMSNNLNSILTVYFEEAPTSGGPHDRMKLFMDMHYRATPDVKIV